MSAPSGEHRSASRHSAGARARHSSKNARALSSKGEGRRDTTGRRSGGFRRCAGGLRNWLGSLALWYNHTAIPLLSPITGPFQDMAHLSRASFLNGPPQPLVLSLPQPAADPFELYRRIASPHRPSFLLESGKGNDSTARYSFMGSNPYMTLTGKNGACVVNTSDRKVVLAQTPFDCFQRILLDGKISRPDGVPPFFGGAIGFLSYDLARSFETLPSLVKDDLDLPDLCFVFVDLLAALDHGTRTLHLIFCPPLARMLSEPREKLYREGYDRLAELESRLTSRSVHADDAEPWSALEMHPDQTRQAYMDRVRQCQEYIAAGDIYQANLSHRFTLTWKDAAVRPGPGRSAAWQPLAVTLYDRLRRVNPAPFSALLTFDDVCLVSCSPERLVRRQGRHVETRPIAGTRPRGRNRTEDQRLIDELLTSPKERAEHLMLVDLERNDLGRVCEFGSVRVDEFMLVEQYSHVSHLVSNIVGTLRPAMNAGDLIKAVFPGGTITGVPKIRCMEIIESLEPVRRGPYTGSLGYLSWSGDLDLSIVIRTLVLTGEHGYLQVGAGIVADSDPAREYDETLFKALAFFKALQEA